jgi:competence protein ComEA
MQLSKWLFSLGLLLASSFALAGPVDINSADAQTLSSAINGVGVKRAEAIVAYRDEHGSFKSVSDLSKVKGIGLKIVEANKDNLVAIIPKK